MYVILGICWIINMKTSSNISWCKDIFFLKKIRLTKIITAPNKASTPGWPSRTVLGVILFVIGLRNQCAVSIDVCCFMSCPEGQDTRVRLAPKHINAMGWEPRNIWLYANHLTLGLNSLSLSMCTTMAWELSYIFPLDFCDADSNFHFVKPNPSRLVGSSLT